MKFRIFVSVIAALALLGAGCGDKNKVGDDQLLNFEEQAQQRLGSTTTTTAAPADATTSTTAASKAGIGNTTTTAKQTTTTAPRPAALEISINPDSAPSLFSPPDGKVYAGALVRWTNTDSVARSVKGDKREFTSPPIPPGGTWEWKAAGSGRITYSDGTRPYAVAAIEVVAR